MVLSRVYTDVALTVAIVCSVLFCFIRAWRCAGNSRAARVGVLALVATAAYFVVDLLFCTVGGGSDVLRAVARLGFCSCMPTRPGPLPPPQRCGG